MSFLPKAIGPYVEDSNMVHIQALQQHKVSPRRGTVNFISKGHAGRASDEYIPEDNGSLIKLQAGNVMLANWGVQCGG